MNFKARCVYNVSGNRKSYTAGKVYEFVNGFSVDDLGRIFPHESCGGPIINIDKLNEWSCSTWELVEEKKTPFEYLLDYYDIKIDEVFILNGKKVFVNKKGMLLNENGTLTSGLLNILIGSAKIEKLPWKPKNGETVWRVSVCNGIVRDVFDKDSPFDLAMYVMGWYFPTKEEAEAHKDEVLRQMKEVMDGPDKSI